MYSLLVDSCVLKTAGQVANSVDPDQMPHSVASDQGLHCLLKPICPNISGKQGTCIAAT